ncbi:MAG: glycoside hydrolase family 92 protein, partial [Muribaculaceae bacterium]|nr:glycoside hydrolase family 92 protein [Muribaculaceae bacterium]
HAGRPWLTQYWVRQVKEKAYGSISPSRGYGGHDEDQGQMSGVSALMAIGLFSINGGSAINPYYEITSPIFDEIIIKLDKEYYSGDEFRIKTYGNSDRNCYIQRAELNGRLHESFRIDHDDFAKGGVLELWLGDTPNEEWGIR